MKNFLIYYGVIIVILTSCESNSSEEENEVLQEPISTNLVESTTLFDGEEITIYTDMDKGEIFVKDEGNLKSISELSENGNMGFYVSSDFEGFAIFSTKEKMNETLEIPIKLTEFNQKMNMIRPIEGIFKSTKNTSFLSASTSSTSSVTVASGHSFGGDVFTKHLGGLNYSWYSNPHLRCNQYETDCINFNDVISSIRVVEATAEFYTGSYANVGWWLYINSLSGTTEILNLNSVGFNDQITCFWAQDSWRQSMNRAGFPTTPNSCSHNYNDPLCP